MLLTDHLLLKFKKPWRASQNALTGQIRGTVCPALVYLQVIDQTQIEVTSYNSLVYLGIQF